MYRAYWIAHPVGRCEPGSGTGSDFSLSFAVDTKQYAVLLLSKYCSDSSALKCKISSLKWVHTGLRCAKV